MPLNSSASKFCCFHHPSATADSPDRRCPPSQLSVHLLPPPLLPLTTHAHSFHHNLAPCMQNLTGTLSNHLMLPRTILVAFHATTYFTRLCTSFVRSPVLCSASSDGATQPLGRRDRSTLLSHAPDDSKIFANGLPSLPLLVNAPLQ